MSDQQNLILAIAISVAIIVGFQYFYPSKVERDQARQQEISEEAPAAPGEAAGVSSPDSTVPKAPTAGAAPEAERPRPAQPSTAQLTAVPRVKIESPRLQGSISLTGGRLDDLTLVDYRQTTEPDSAEIALFLPTGSASPYFAEFGWIAQDGVVKVPGPETPWRADSRELTPERPVTLTWDNGQGLRFVRTYALDYNYMFTVTQRVENRGKDPVTLYPYGLVSRTGTPKTLGFFILHEGPLGVFNGTLEEKDYDDLQDAGAITQSTRGGWIGITDKYWLAALAPDQKQKVETRFLHTLAGDTDKYQVDYRGEGRILAPGANTENASYLFAGAKEVKLLDAYAKDLGIELFDRAIDFGLFYFITKPIFYALAFFNEHLGNFGLAILLLTVMIKAAFFPLANKSYKAMGKMKKLQPQMMKLRDRFKEDRARMNQEIMALYKREKTNPASGCLPMVIQIPVFFALYKVLFVTIEMRHAPFFGWIEDLSARDPTSVFNLFGLLPFTLPDFLMLGAWPLIMGLSMFLQMRLNPQPADPIQAKIFMFMPIMFTFILAPFPAGLVIYWAWNN
ncbi:MAG: membrane protein insertase YidC, partial [Alphaproteobacteria bacterium]